MPDDRDEPRRLEVVGLVNALVEGVRSSVRGQILEARGGILKTWHAPDTGGTMRKLLIRSELR